MKDDENISPNSTKIKKNISLEDIKIFFKDRFIDFTNLPHTKYNLITNIKPSENLKFFGKIDNNDIWLETTSNMYLCGLPNSPTRSWYKIKQINDIDIFQDFYEKNMDKKPTSILRMGITLDKISFTEFIQYIYFHEFTEKNICETQHDLMHSIRENAITLEDKIRIYNNFIKSETKNFYIKTKYSKSIMYFENYNEYIIVSILFNELKLKNRYEKYPSHFPSDICIIFNSFEKIFYLDIIDLLKNNVNTEITKHIDILFKIGEPTQIKKDLKNIIVNEDTGQYIKQKNMIIESDLIFNKIEKEGVFKAFENSFDILMKTFYEKINGRENIDQLYLTTKFKNKIEEIFKIKLL